MTTLFTPGGGWGGSPPNGSVTLAMLASSFLLTSAYGGTGNAYTEFTGPTTTKKTFTLPNATCSILTTNAAVTPAQGGTGVANNAANTQTFSGNYAITWTLTGVTALTLPTSGTLATQAYVAAAVAGLLDYKGGYDASTNTPDLDMTPTGVLKGDMYTVTAAGTFFTAALEVGDAIIAEIDDASTEFDWTILQKNLLSPLNADTISDGAVSTAAKLADGVVTYAKMQDASAGNVVLARAAGTSGDYSEVALAASRLLGRGSTGDVAAIALGTNLSFDGTTLNATGGGTTLVNTADGRLTLTTGTPVLTTGVTAATTLYYTPFIGSQIALYNGSTWDLISFSEVSLSLASYTTNKNYDVWGYNNAGTLTLDSTVWTNDSTRATALVRQDGVWCKTGALTRRYLGTIRIYATGECEFSFGAISAGGTEAKAGVFNAQNQVPFSFKTGDSVDSYAYSTATWRSANASNTNRISFVIGLTGAGAFAAFNHFVSGNPAHIGIGYDSTSAVSGQTSTHYAGYTGQGRASFDTLPAPGYHYFQALEHAGATWYGDDGQPGVEQAGLSATIWM